MSGLGRRAILFGGGFILASARANAADYPARPVRIVVPYPAGGSNDIVARIFAQKLAERHGTGFIVDNRAGASGNIGAKIVADSEPSGYTLLLTAPPPLTINNALYTDLRYDAATDFSPVALIASVPIVLTVSTALGVGTVQDLIAMARAKPGSINFGSAGIGSTGHLAGQLFKAKTGIDIVHVPYRGEAPAIIDLIAGSTQMMFNNLPSVLPQVQAETVKILAVAGATRARALPDIPTIAESGVPGFAASAWFGLVAPAKTPDAIVATLIADVAAILRDPETQARLAAIGAEPGTVSSKAFRQTLSTERLTWGAIITASGAKADQ
jgi:tripartite-type tricarboxylate transporter receptor subunit TctC